MIKAFMMVCTAIIIEGSDIAGDPACVVKHDEDYLEFDNKTDCEDFMFDFSAEAVYSSVAATGKHPRKITAWGYKCGQ